MQDCLRMDRRSLTGDGRPARERRDLEERDHGARHRPEACRVVDAEEQRAHDAEEVVHEDQQNHDVAHALRAREEARHDDAQLRHALDELEMEW